MMKKLSSNTQSRKQKLVLSAISAGILAMCGANASASVTNPVIGNLLWSDEFNGTSLDTSLWTAVDGNGCQINLCGYGNQELEYYSPNNLSIVNVPFEPATRALAITAQNQTVGSNVFTSGRVSSLGKVQVKYGMVEMRVSTPAVGTGLWPAMWMLGTSPQTWPRNGEIDIMEMGHSAAARQMAGSPPINNYSGSNVITYQDAACVPGNESCAASTAWQTKNWYISSSPMVNRFVTYRLYWTDTQMRFTVIDNGVEYNMYDSPLPVNSTSLQAPFYLLFNLAVGGNFTDAANPSQVTAPLPGTMYVDYVRVYQLDGLGEVKVGNPNPPEVGKFGVFTDNTVVSNKLVAGTSSDIWNWNTASMSGGTTPPYEGSNVMAWNYTAPNQWFGSSVQARQVHDMSNYRNGTLSFKIKIPANVAFKVGIGDTYTNQGTVTFPANTTAYGLTRDGNWGTATIPVSTITGSLVALQSMSDLFQIFSVDGSLPGSTFQWAVDDIVWDTGAPAPVGPAGYTYCANENGTCNLPVGTSNSVAFGANGSFAYKTVTGSTACTTAVFGDPAAGVAKACFYQAGSAPTPAPTPTPTPAPTPAPTPTPTPAPTPAPTPTPTPAPTPAPTPTPTPAPTPAPTPTPTPAPTPAPTPTPTPAPTPAPTPTPTPAPTPTPTPTGSVTLFQDCNYAGGWSASFGIGSYHLSDIIAHGGRNDDASSIRIPAGYTVTMYKDDNFTGTAVTLTGDNSCFVGVNFNDVLSSMVVSATPTPTPAPTPTPTPAPTPTPTPSCTLQAEDYSGAYDATTGNAGGAYRTGDVDIEATSDTGGGYDVGWIDTGEWLAHNNVTFPTTGSYTIQYRVASINSTGVISADLNSGSIQLGTTAVPNTGGWQVWTTVQRTVNVNAGTYSLGTFMSTGGFNLNWIKILGASCGATPTPTPTPAPTPTPTPAPTPTPIYSATETSASTLLFTVNTSSWADVHYTVNGGGQQNIRLTQSNGSNTYTTTGLKVGDVVNYNFTYWDVANSTAIDTPQQSYTMK